MSRNTEATDDVKTWTGGPLNYKEGFFTRLQTDELAKGINEEVVRAISARRNEPQWMLEFRLNAYRAWLEMEEPHWLKAHYDKLNYQDYSYYSAPSCGNCDETCASEPGAVQQTGANSFLTSEVEEAFNQLGVPVREGREVAVDAIFDSVSVATTYREKLAEQGIIHKDAEVKYSTVQNWFPGDNNTGGILNFVTKRALCEGENSKMSWTQSETGS
ncbi:SufD family Fe-S cluster assembly protein, partial [Klebsiella pneumoniae]|nr:SufD family Fe-S cluster assembly protein [Klebsiella pneumoniae]